MPTVDNDTSTSNACPKQKPWSIEHYCRCHDKFTLFDTSGGRRGWDPEQKDNHEYITSICKNDDIVGPYGSSKNSGFSTNKKSQKLLNGYKKSAEQYLGVKEVNDEYLKEEMERFDRRFSFVQPREILGKGTFGIVYKGHDKESNSAVAIKVPRIIDNPEKYLEQGRKEVRIWKTISTSPFILDLLEYFVSTDGKSKIPLLCTVSPFIGGGTLMEYIVGHGNEGLPGFEAWLASKQLILAVKHMHIHDVVHRDIKPDNILVKQGLGGNFQKILLIDLGTSRRFMGGPRSDTLAGTDLYMAPEVKEGNYVLPKVDVYSIGMTILLMAVGLCPDKANMKSWFNSLDIAQVFSEYSENQLVQTARLMVKENPFERCSLSDVLELLLQQRPTGLGSRANLVHLDTDFTEAYRLLLRTVDLEFLRHELELAKGGALEQLCVEFNERYLQIMGGGEEESPDIVPAVSSESASINSLD